MRVLYYTLYIGMCHYVLIIKVEDDPFVFQTNISISSKYDNLSHGISGSTLDYG